jgi:hypothetical protein
MKQKDFCLLFDICGSHNLSDELTALQETVADMSGAKSAIKRYIAYLSKCYMAPKLHSLSP